MATRLRAIFRPPALRLWLFGLGVIVLWLAMQWAAPSASEPSAAFRLIPDSTQALPVRLSSDPSPLRFRYGLVLVVLAAGTVLSLYLLRRKRPPHSSTLLRPIGQLSLGPGQQIRLVVCGKELLILGVTTHQITLLKSLPLPPELQTDHAETPPATSFARLLTHLSNRTAPTDHAS